MIISTPIKSINDQATKLRLMVNVLKDERQRIERETKDVSVHKESVEKNLVKLQEVIVDTVAEFEQFCDQATDIVSKYLDTIKDSGNLLASYRKFIESVNGTLESAQREVNQAKENSSTLQAEILREGERLSIVKKDLDIYRSRLEKLWNELNPGIPMNL